jgi:UDP-N-acetylmuramyl tripeptide synthase
MSILSRLDNIQKFTSITADSRKVSVGSLFLAYLGEGADGRSYIPQAIEAGATAVIWEASDFTWKMDWQVSNFAVKGLKQQVGHIAAEYHHHPSSKLNMIGVTGTNGKTSVSQWLAQCLTDLGKKTAVLGTIGNGLLGKLTEAKNTTPDSIARYVG